jgi:hypothetical protein
MTQCSPLIELCQDGPQPPGLFVISVTGIDNECVWMIPPGVVDDRIGAQLGLKFLECL